MNASARATTDIRAAAPGSLYAIRDDLARSFNPANAHERMLVTAVAQAWQRLQQAYELERRVFNTVDPLELFNNHHERFKAIDRYVATCDRIWRHALAELRRVQRSRRQPAFQPRTPVVTTRQFLDDPQRPRTIDKLGTSSHAPAQTAHPRNP